jgi:hypothetical protein
MNKLSKHIIVSSITTTLIVFLLWVNNSILWPFTGIRYCLNSEYVRVIYMTPNSYRSWGLDYSYGLQCQENGSFKNLWHFPKWHKTKLIYEKNGNIL